MKRESSFCPGVCVMFWPEVSPICGDCANTEGVYFKKVGETSFGQCPRVVLSVKDVLQARM